MRRSSSPFLLLVLLLLSLLFSFTHARLVFPFSSSNPLAAATTTTRTRSRPTSNKPSTSRGAFHFPHRDHELVLLQHEGAKLNRSSTWSRFVNSTHNLIEDMKDLSDEKEAVRQFYKNHVALDHIEERLSGFWTRTKPFVSLGMKGVGGLTMMLSGAHFGRCVVLFHTIRVTGWPSFHKALVEVGKTYQRAREVVKKEVGHVPRPRELLSAVSYELNSVRSIIKNTQTALDDGKITKAEAKEAMRKAQIDRKRLEYEAAVLNQAVDSFAALGAAIDFANLKAVSKGVYTGALACVASANSGTVRKLSLAFDLGGIIGDNINKVCHHVLEAWHMEEQVKVIPPETRRFLRNTVTIMGTIQGLLIARSLPKMSLRISSAALGSAWFIDAVDPYLKEKHWDYITPALQVVGTGVGYYVQKRVYPGKFPIYVERFLTPLALAEQQLKGFNGLFKK